MLGFHKRNQPVLLKRTLVKLPRSRRLRVASAYGRLRLPIVLSLLLIVALNIAAPMSFGARQGKLTGFISVSARNGGKVVFSLGPAGSLVFHTHRTPVNLNVDLEFNGNITDGQTAREALANGTREFYLDAKKAFMRFLAVKAMLLIVFGMLAGILESNSGGKLWKRKMAWDAFDGVLAVAIVASVFVVATVATVNKVIPYNFTGISAKLLPEVVNSIEQSRGNYHIPGNTFDYIGKGGMVALRQAKRLHQMATTPSTRIRILAGADFHDNIELGVGLFASILRGEWKPFDAVFLAGDLTDYGAQYQASMYAGKIGGGKIPKRIVGGNHENAPAMREFQKIGLPSLNMQVLAVGSLRVFGVDDPQAETFDMDSNEEGLRQNSKAAADLWSSLGQNKPRVILVHDPAQAEGIIELAKKDGLPLTVIYGHNHRASIERQGNITYIGCGTGGASGYRGLSEDANTLYTYQIIDFSTGDNPKLLSVMTLTYNGETRETTRTPHLFIN
jgi:predicted phosphodiesterase